MMVRHALDTKHPLAKDAAEDDLTRQLAMPKGRLRKCQDVTGGDTDSVTVVRQTICALKEEISTIMRALKGLYYIHL